MHTVSLGYLCGWTFDGFAAAGAAAVGQRAETELRPRRPAGDAPGEDAANPPRPRSVDDSYLF